MKVINNRYLLLFVSLFGACGNLPATIDFQNMSSRLVFDNTSAQLLIKNRQKILGWQKLSIVKENGNVPATNWIEGYSNNVTIGPVGATKTPQTNLIVANSNAVTLIPSLLTPTPVPAANSIDGTSWVQYKTKHHVFHNGPWRSQGYVRFNDGFTIMPLGSVLMDTITSVSGGMDLRNTGTLILAGDLYLAHNVTLTNGGNIKGKASVSGQANTIFMGGDLTLAADTYSKALHITGDWSNRGTSGDLIIDGCGHTLNIQDWAQIFVDQNITLTLRNMTIKTSPLSLNKPSILLTSLGSKLALDNVIFDLGADFNFKQGQLFIHNDVAVTGISAFVYQSPKPSYITSGATWSFEQGTTFSVAPSTFTDCPFTLNKTYTNNAFIVLADATAALSLNSCSFQTTFTGSRFIKGMMLFDNKVAIDTTAGLDLNATTPLTELGSGTAAASAIFVSWSPDSRYLAVACGGNLVRMYTFNGSSAPTQIGSGFTVSGGPQSVSWAADGRTIAIQSQSPGFVHVYNFTGLSLPTEIGTGVSLGTVWSVAMSPDGRFIAAPNVSDATSHIYRFNGAALPVEIGSGYSTTDNAIVVAWSPDGRYLAHCSGNRYVRVFKFNGTSVPSSVGAVADTGAASGLAHLAWSSDGRYIAAVCQTTNILHIYRFYGGLSLVEIGTGFALGGGAVPLSVSWSPNGRFIAVGCWNSSTIRVFQFDGSSVITEIGSGLSAANRFIAWSPDGNFIATAETTTNKVHVYRLNWISTPVTQQSFTNGLLFGQSSLGSSYNANVQVLDGATVTVKGMVTDDSV